MNNLDPEVAERPDDLVVYGGIGARRATGTATTASCGRCASSATTRRLLVQSASRVGVFRTHPDAPRVLIANSNLVGRWATWDHFHELDRKGLMMYGQMTAGSWIYIGSQGIVQGTYETFVEMGRQHYAGDLAGAGSSRGPRRHGWRAAARGNHAGASMLAVECAGSASRSGSTRATSTCGPRRWTSAGPDRARERRPQGALRRPARQCVGGAAGALAPRVRPDAVTDQTSAHDPVNGYLPEGWTLEQWTGCGRAIPRRRGPPGGPWRSTSRRCSPSSASASRSSTRQQHPASGVRRGRQGKPSRSRDSSPHTSGRCSARRRPVPLVALSGNPRDIHRTTSA